MAWVSLLTAGLCAGLERALGQGRDPGRAAAGAGTIAGAGWERS